MRRVVQLALAAAIAASVGGGAWAVAVAAGLTAGIPPGHTMRDQQLASGEIGDANGDFVEVTLQSGTVSFRTHGGAVVTKDNTAVVSALAFTSDGLVGFGCWTVPSSWVTFNIQTQVTVTFDSTDPRLSGCPGLPLGPALATGQTPLLTDSSVFGFTGRIAFSATWKNSGSLTYFSSTMNTTCGAYSAVDQMNMRDYGGGFALSVTALTVEGTNPSTGLLEDVDLSHIVGVGPVFGDVNETTENIVVNGPATGSCGQFGS